MADDADRIDRHADHDLLLIAGLVDRDPTADRALAESWIATCASCSALHADLLVLSKATATLATPPRPRAFTLTAADAALLTAPRTGEPGVEAARLGGVMTDLHAPLHATHDRMLVASLADHSLALAERAAAEALVAVCDDCAALHADLLALRAATQAMTTPSRPRDFVLSQADATRLRSGGWRRFLATLGSSRDALSRPLAVGLTTLGLAGLLVATVPSVLTGYGGGATSAAPEVQTTVGAPIPGAAAPGAATGADTTGSGDDTGAPATAAAAPVAAGSLAPLPDGVVPVYGAQASPATGSGGNGTGAAILDQGATPPPGTESVTSGSSKGQTGGAPSRGREPGSLLDLLGEPDDTSPSTLVVLSGAFLIAGLGLFAIRWTARRIGDD